MLVRIPPVRKSAPLVLTVFVCGAGVGALIIARSHHSAAKSATVRRAVRSAPTAPSKPSAQLPAASEGVQPDRQAKPESPTAVSGETIVPAGADSSFASLAARLGGSVGVAVAPLGQGPVQTFGSLQEGHAWSTMKVPVLVTLLAEDERTGRSLGSTEREDASLALEQSDTAAAEALFRVLERRLRGVSAASAAVQSTLANAGDQSTEINTAPNSRGFTTWGQSIWSASGEVLFFRALARGCLLAQQENAKYVLDLMRNVISSQRWGAGEAGYPSSAQPAFKAGWGPENGGGYLVRQTAIVGSGSRGYVVSMTALPAGGSFSEGVRMVTDLASWARAHFNLDAGAAPAHCGGVE